MCCKEIGIKNTEFVAKTKYLLLFDKVKEKMFLKRLKTTLLHESGAHSVDFLPQNERRVLRDTIQMCMKPNLQLKNNN